MSGDKANGFNIDDVEIGSIVAEQQQSNGAPSLIAGFYTGWKFSGEDAPTNVRIGSLRVVGSHSYGVYIDEDADAFIGSITLDDNDDSIRPGLLINGDARLVCNYIKCINQKNDAIHINDGAELSADVVEVHPFQQASQNVIERVNSADDTQRVTIREMKFIGTPTESGTSHSPLYGVFLDSVPMANVNIQEAIEGGHSLTGMVRFDGADVVDAYRGGIPHTSSAITGGTYTAGDRYVDDEGYEYRYDGSDWRGGNPDVGELTIASGAITLPNKVSPIYVSVDTEADASTDDLDTINGTFESQMVILRAASGNRTVVAKDGTGNLRMSADFSLDNTEDVLLFVSDGTNLYQIAGSNNEV